MKTPDEIKKGLACDVKKRGFLLDCSNCAYHGRDLTPCRIAVHDDALEYIQKLEASQHKWISVEDRLPIEPQECLIVLYGQVYTAWAFGDGDFETSSGVVWNADEVTHWMPLPEPPKED